MTALLLVLQLIGDETASNLKSGDERELAPMKSCITKQISMNNGDPKPV